MFVAVAGVFIGLSGLKNALNKKTCSREKIAEFSMRQVGRIFLMRVFYFVGRVLLGRKIAAYLRLIEIRTRAFQPIWNVFFAEVGK